jgi:uncharacterized phage-associated protein
MNENKQIAFEYIMFKLIDWYKEVKRPGHKLTDEEFNAVNDFSVLKVIKLLYFTVAINSKNNNVLLNMFDQFVAMQYGHVESELYNHIKEHGGVFNRFRIDYNGTQITIQNGIENSFGDFLRDNQPVATEIDKAVLLLRKYNTNKFIVYGAYDYVNMSHALDSWKLVFAIGKKHGINSRINSDYIKNDGQIFVLN